MRDDENRLSRWSRLKREAADADAGAEVAPEPASPPEIAPEVLEANRTAAEAIDPDTIDETTDMRLFEREGVPDWLRKRAFAALWRSNPVFANVDGLNDYDDDFADPGLVMTTFKSAWQAGRGYLEELVEKADGAQETDKAIEVAEAEPPAAVPAEASVSLASVEDEAGPELDEAPPVEAAKADEPEEVPRVPLRARLTFE